MITLMISDDEMAAKEAILKALESEGYIISDDIKEENCLRVVKKDCIRDLAFIKGRVIELKGIRQDSLNGRIYKTVLGKIEKPLLEYVLEMTQGNQLKAAKALGLNRNTLRTKLRKLGINPEKWRNI